MNQAQKNSLKNNYPTLNKLANLSGNSIVELIMVLMDYKPATAEPVYFNEKLRHSLLSIQKYANKLGLYLATSDFKYIINSPQGIFTEVPLSDRQLGKIVISLSKSADKARKGAVYYHKKMLNSTYGYKFGELMGYPKCCLKFGDYLANNNNNPNNFGFKNPAIESLKRSKDFDWHLNVFTLSLIPHFPCNLNCKKSIKYVERVFECLDYLNKKDSSIQKDHLKEPSSLYWTCADRILLYGNHKTYSLGTGEVDYSKIESIITSSTFYQEVDKTKISLWKKIETRLKQGNRLVVTEDYCKIYKGKKMIFKFKKNDKYTPVLIKPNILA